MATYPRQTTLPDPDDFLKSSLADPARRKTLVELLRRGPVLSEDAGRDFIGAAPGRATPSSSAEYRSGEIKTRTPGAPAPQPYRPPVGGGSALGSAQPGPWSGGPDTALLGAAPAVAGEDGWILDYVRRNPEQGRKLISGLSEPAPAMEAMEEEPAPGQPLRPSADDSPFDLAAYVSKMPLPAQADFVRNLSRPRQSIRRQADGSYTNVGESGEVVVQGGESVGPDIGAPGRGTVSQSSLDDVAYLPPSVYEEAERRRHLATDRMLARDPLAIERERERIRGESEERRETARERARIAGSGVEQQRRFIVSQADDMEAEIDARLRAGQLTPERAEAARSKLRAAAADHLYNLERGVASERARKRTPDAYAGDEY